MGAFPTQIPTFAFLFRLKENFALSEYRIMRFRFLFVCLLLLVCGLAAKAQTTPPVQQPQPDPNQIELVQADALEGGKFKGQEIR